MLSTSACGRGASDRWEGVRHWHLSAVRDGKRGQPDDACSRTAGGSQGWGATPPPDAEFHYDFRFASMAELVAAHRAEQQGRPSLPIGSA
jgi:hypothetical protein